MPAGGRPISSSNDPREIVVQRNFSVNSVAVPATVLGPTCVVILVLLVAAAIHGGCSLKAFLGSMELSMSLRKDVQQTDRFWRFAAAERTV